MRRPPRFFRLPSPLSPPRPYPLPPRGDPRPALPVAGGAGRRGRAAVAAGAYGSCGVRGAPGARAARDDAAVRADGQAPDAPEPRGHLACPGSASGRGAAMTHALRLATERRLADALHYLDVCANDDHEDAPI